MPQGYKKANRSAYLNFLQAKYEAYTGAVRVASHPYHAMIDPCDLCQLRCPTCPTGIENEGKLQHTEHDTTYRTTRSMLTTDLFDALLDEMGEYLFQMQFHSWGEPLLNKDVATFVKKAHAREIQTQMHTNLSLPLSDQRIEDLLSSGLDFLIASVDGFSQKTYEKFRVGGNLALVKDNLERAARIRDTLGLGTGIVYKFLVFSWNEHELADAQRYSAEIGINFVPQDAGIPDATWLPSYRKDEKPILSEHDVQVLDKQWRAAGKGDYWKEHEKHSFWIPVHPGNHWVPTDHPTGSSFCGWHYGVAVIQPGGQVSPCCMAAKEDDVFGRVTPGRVPFADIWNNDLYRKSRSEFAGKNVPGLEKADTICMRCYYPDPLKHVFSSSYDSQVIAQFLNVFAGTDPVLERAFELLPLDESAPGRKSFVEFFEEKLIRHIPEM